jgi:phage antirepressor YoqD-like protein
VIRLVREYLADFQEFGGVRFEIEPFETAGGRQSREIAYLNEDQATLLLTYMRNSEVVRGFKKRLIHAFRELVDAASKPVVPQLSRLEILQLALESEQCALAAEAKLVEQAPKVAFVDKYATAEGNKGVREVVKLLDANEREFVAFLVGTEIMYRLNGRLTAYAHHQHAGRFVVKTGIGGNERAFTQSLFTPRGVQWIAQKWAEYQSAHSSVEAA